MTRSVPRGWFFLLFTISGFAGLIYESIWSHYLKLFLGHTAYAQTLVLAIFMGGMALGSWLCSRFSVRWRNLLLGYAVTEAVIGVLALVFHRTFVGLTDFAYDSVMPALGTPLAVNAFKWGLAALIILPQSLLLGMTFPLMTSGLIRAYPDRSGGTIAMLYFTNSLGAAIGVLASGFFLIAALGLPGTILTAGSINIALAAAVWLLARQAPAHEGARHAAMAARGSPPASGYGLMLAVSLLTGAASFMYEIGWIRMLSMVLGSSTHAFELMLSAFILGLAFGGLWIKRRIDGFARPESVLGLVQVAMGLLALGTLLVYGRTFELMQALMGALARSESGYAMFNFGSHLIALLVMFPVAFCAGMTLPLITHVLLRRGTGERAIGAVYAANTVGAIAGVVLAVHLAMPVLGLKGLITLGASVDILLGLVLLWRFTPHALAPRVAAALGGAAVAATVAWIELDSLKMASGVYRQGKLMRQGEAEILFHRDGKTATVNLVHASGLLSITTNGKSDAMVNMVAGAEVAADEPTNVLLGALPLALRPDARSAAVIGIGSGISSHVLLASDGLRELDTIEIEPAMVEAARGFRPRNAALFDDPRSRIHIEDAKTFFAAQGKRYDLIVSEPSNPWVSGVAGLFTEEFYRRVRRHLEPGGLFVQWLQLYEIEPALVASVMKALSRNFSHYEIYASDEANLIIVARDGTPVAAPSDAAFQHPRLGAALARLQVRSAADLDVFRLGSRQALQPYFNRFAIAPNSDYFPVLDQNAARARFMDARADEIVELANAPIPAIDFLGGHPRREASVAPRAWLKRSELIHAAQEGRAFLLTGGAEHLERLPAGLRSDLELVRLALFECQRSGRMISVGQLSAVAGALLPYLSPQESQALWRALSEKRCAPLAEPQASWLALFTAVGVRDAAEMTRVAELLLSTSGGGGPHSDYVLAAAIIGRLARGEHEHAASLWHRFAGGVVSGRRNMLPELLQGHLFAPEPENAAMSLARARPAGDANRQRPTGFGTSVPVQRVTLSN